MVTVAFYKAYQSKANWEDKLIAKYTHGSYSHCEIIIDGYMYSSSPRDGRVRKKKHIVDMNIWKYIHIDIEAKNILQFFDLTKGCRYDWLGILGFIIPFKDRTNKWFCSEWCSNALKISEYKKLWKLEPSKISPNRLYDILT